MQFDEVRELAKSIVSVEVEAMNDAGEIHFTRSEPLRAWDQAVRDAVQGVITGQVADLLRDERVVGTH